MSKIGLVVGRVLGPLHTSTVAAASTMPEQARQAPVVDEVAPAVGSIEDEVTVLRNHYAEELPATVWEDTNTVTAAYRDSVPIPYLHGNQRPIA